MTDLETAALAADPTYLAIVDARVEATMSDLEELAALDAFEAAQAALSMPEHF